MARTHTLYERARSAAVRPTRRVALCSRVRPRSRSLPTPGPSLVRVLATVVLHDRRHRGRERRERRGRRGRRGRRADGARERHRQDHARRRHRRPCAPAQSAKRLSPLGERTAMAVPGITMAATGTATKGTRKLRATATKAPGAVALAAQAPPTDPSSDASPLDSLFRERALQPAPRQPQPRVGREQAALQPRRHVQHR